jgi:hypothetical protein
VHGSDTVDLTVEMRPRRPRATRLATAVAAALLAVLALAAVAAGLPPFTTAPKSASGGTTQAQTSAIATACHRTFDRFVIRLRGGTPGYGVRYVRRVVSDGSGAVVPLLGKRRIRVVLHDTRAHTPAGAAILPRVLTPRCSNLRQVKLAGDFEGVVTFGLGLERRTGFRVFRLTRPARVVVDVAH